MAVADLPVIASSDRTADLENFCNRTYNANEKQWREIFPWEFPQNATTPEPEEAFLRDFFSPADIHLFGYRFLKQAWYSMALWNFNIKMPSIANWYIQNNQTVVTDASVSEHILREDVALQTFFEERDVQMWGEKMLKNVIPLIQYKVRELKGLDHDAERTPKAKVKLPAVETKDTAASEPAAVTQAEVSSAKDLAVLHENQEAVLESVEAASNELPPPADNRRRARTNSSTGYAPPLQNRKRGNSLGKYQNNTYANRYQNARYDQQRGPPNPYYNPQHTGSPAYAPSPVVAHAPPPPMQAQMRVPTGGATPFIPGSTPYPQAFNGPPPPGAYGPMQPYPPDQPFQQQMPMQYQGQGPVPPDHQQVFDPRMGGEPFYERTNNRFGNRGYGYEQMPEGDEYEAYGLGNRRDSNASRGRGRDGRGSRGRNSFVGSRPQNFGDGYGGFQRRSSQEFGPGPGPEQHGFGYKRRNITFSDKSWRNQGPPMQQCENVPPRMFSEPFYPGNAQPPPSIPETFGSTAPVPEKLRENRFPRREASRQAQSPQLQPNTEVPALPTNLLIHDENHFAAAKYPERVLTKHRIGLECGHVKKIIFFRVKSPVTDQAVLKYIGQYGTVVKRKPFGDKRTEDNEPFHELFITFATHMDARNALNANGTYWAPLGIIKVEVPREYWDPQHDRYPGEGHPEQAPHYHRYSTSSYKPEFGHRAFLTETPAIESMTAKVEPAKSPTQEEAVSESTTPTASGATTPKKKPKKNKQKKGQAQRDFTSRPPPKQRENTASEETAFEAKSETSEVTAIHSPAGDSAAMTKNAAEEIETTPRAAKNEMNDSVIDDPEAVQAKPKPALDPETSSKASTPPTEHTASEATSPPASLDAKEQPTIGRPSDEDAAQPFRGPSETEEKTQVSEDVHIDEPVNDQSATLNPTAETKASTEQAEEEPADDSFHTADGSPESQKNGRRQDRGSEESTVSTTSDGTVVFTPESAESPEASKPKVLLPTEASTRVQESGGSQKAVDVQGTKSPESTASTKNKKRASVPNLPKVKIVAEPTPRRDSGSVMTTEQAGGSLVPPPPTPGFVTAPTTPAEPITPTEPISTAQIPTLEAIDEELSPKPAAPMDTIPENEELRPKEMDAASEETSTTAPPPLFFDKADAKSEEDTSTVTALSQLPKEADMKSKDDPTSSISPPQSPKETDVTSKDGTVPATVPSQPPKKAEKVKGPSQTESLSMFSKKAQPKPKKSKAQKSKGSIKGKPRVEDDAASEAYSETTSRAVSGVETPRSMAEDVFGPSNGKIDSIDERLEIGPDNMKTSAPTTDKTTKGEKKSAQSEPQSTLSRDASPSKSRGLGNFFSSIFSAPSSQANTPDMKAIEPSVKTPPTHSKSDGTVPQPKAKPTEATDPVADAKSASDAAKASISPPAPMQMTTNNPRFAGDAEQPFRSFRAGDAERGVRDSGDSGGAVGGALGLGITADDNTSPATGPAPDTGVKESAEAETKTKKKKKKNNKKKGKKSEAAKDSGIDEEEAAEVVGETEEPKTGAAASDMKVFSGNTQGFPAKTAVPQLEAPSEPGSEASSATLGRTESREQTPSSTAATSSQQSPSKMMNMIKKKSDGHLVQAPPRRKPNNKQRVTSNVKTPEATSPNDSGPNTIWINHSEEENSDDDDSENALDRALEGINKSSMKRDPPVLYLYVGEAAQNQNGEDTSGGNGRSARQMAEQEGEKAEEMARRRLDAQGKENARPGQ